MSVKIQVFTCEFCLGAGCHSCNGKGKIEIDTAIYNCPNCLGRGCFVYGDPLILPNPRLPCRKCNGTGKIIQPLANTN